MSLFVSRKVGLDNSAKASVTEFVPLEPLKRREYYPNKKFK